MKVRYKIYELDDKHLEPYDGVLEYNKRDRICLMEPRLKGFCSSTHDSFEEAVQAVENCGKEFTKYTIIPVVY